MTTPSEADLPPATRAALDEVVDSFRQEIIRYAQVTAQERPSGEATPSPEDVRRAAVRILRAQPDLSVRGYGYLAPVAIGVAFLGIGALVLLIVQRWTESDWRPVLEASSWIAGVFALSASLAVYSRGLFRSKGEDAGRRRIDLNLRGEFIATWAAFESELRLPRVGSSQKQGNVVNLRVLLSDFVERVDLSDDEQRELLRLLGMRNALVHTMDDFDLNELVSAQRRLEWFIGIAKESGK